MDDTGRAWAILGIVPGSSEEAIKAAYREQVKAWHPDRFAGRPDQLDEAQEMLKEINWAYHFLTEHGLAAQPAPAAAPPSDLVDFEPDPPPASHGYLGIALIIVLLIAGAGWFLTKAKKTGPVAATPPAPTIISPPTTNLAAPAEAKLPPLADKNIVRKMIPGNQVQVTDSPDGLVLKAGITRDSLRTPFSVRPPFVFRATVKTDGADLRFYYGLGLVIFNWGDNPIELRVHDFSTSAATAHRGQGALKPNEWHELVFDVRTNALTISVDGQTRFEGPGFYRNLNTTAGLGPVQGEVIVQSVIVEEAPDAALTAKPALQPRVKIPGDLLDTMIPVDGAGVAQTLEGVVLSDGENVSGYIKTEKSFRAPLTIRTRAKTDSLNLRLYFGPEARGRVIFNWEANPGELRVHDPLTATGIGVPGRGRILPNEWHDIVWDIQRTGMRILVDGQVRFQNRADYSRLEGAAGIGTYLSHVTVAHFTVDQK